MVAGDSHDLRVDVGVPWFSLYGATPPANVTQIIVDRSLEDHADYLRLTIDPKCKAVFSWQQVFVPLTYGGREMETCPFVCNIRKDSLRSGRAAQPDLHDLTDEIGWLIQLDVGRDGDSETSARITPKPERAIPAAPQHLRQAVGFGVEQPTAQGATARLAGTGQ